MVRKYGRGLNREIVGGVNRNALSEPFSIKDIKNFAKANSWNIPETYINTCLANGSATNHSLTYKKYFISLGDGKYKVSPEYCGGTWK